MKRTAMAIAFLLLFPASAGADGIARNVWHLIAPTKEIFGQEVGLATPFLVDAYSSVRCQHLDPTGCIETSPGLPAHPTAGQTYRMAIAFDALLITADRLFQHFDKGHHNRHVPWIAVGLIIGVQTENIRENWNAPRPHR